MAVTTGVDTIDITGKTFRFTGNAFDFNRLFEASKEGLKRAEERGNPQAQIAVSMQEPEDDQP